MSGKQQPIVVTAAIIQHQREFLIARRKADAKIGAGQWEFPGGKLEFGEEPELCLKREIREELNLEIRVEKIFCVSSHVYETELNSTHIVLLAYLCTYTGGELKLLDVADARWVSHDELKTYDWAEADIPIVDRLVEKMLS